MENKSFSFLRRTINKCNQSDFSMLIAMKFATYRTNKYNFSLKLHKSNARTE